MVNHKNMILCFRL